MVLYNLATALEVDKELVEVAIRPPSKSSLNINAMARLNGIKLGGHRLIRTFISSVHRTVRLKSRSMV